MRNKLYLFLITFLLSKNNFAQYASKQLSSFAVHPSIAIKDSTKKHSPHKASLYSALLPGLGQAYNKKYWKIPIVYAGLGGFGYFILKNRKEMKLRQHELNIRFDNDTNTKPQYQYRNITNEQLKAERNLFRTNRDYSIVGFALFYVINIIDATVDAHFYKFNIDKPLAARKQKNWNIYSSRFNGRNTYGLSFNF